MRIVSLVPSQTELLADLGLEKEVVGITRFCVHPDSWYRTKTRVGGTKNPDLEKIRELKPDLVLANKEENRRDDILQLQKLCSVYVSDIETRDDALEMIEKVGSLTGKTSEAKKIAAEIRGTACPRLTKVLPCAYLIWKDPFMAVGPKTFIHDQLFALGLQNVLDSSDTRYPVVTPDILLRSGIRVLFLSTEPYPFKDSDASYFHDLLPGCEIRIVDGEMFSWYGSRMRLATTYFKELLATLPPA